MELKAIISVFVASPSDVEAERLAVDEVVAELNALDLEGGKVRLETRKWETHTWPGFGEDAQSVINEQIGDYDIFLGIFWNRLGSPTKRAKSGTVEEYDRAYESWKKHQRPSLMFYFKDAPTKLRSQSELMQAGSVLKFEKAVRKLGLTSSFPTTQDFKNLVRKHLNSEVKKIIQRPPPAAPALARNPEPVEAINRLVNKLGYWHVGPTLRAISQIEQAAEAGSPAVKGAAILGLRNFLMVGMAQDDEVATERARTLRVAAFRAIRACARSMTWPLISKRANWRPLTWSESIFQG